MIRADTRLLRVSDPGRRRLLPKKAMNTELPPHSLEAEQGLLGCVLLAGPAGGAGAIIDDITQRLRGPLDFYGRAHQFIWEAIIGLDTDAKGLDLVLVAEKLRERSQLDDVGGIAYLSGLQDSTPSLAHAGHYLAIVADRATQRRLIQAAGLAAALTHGNESSVDEQVSAAQQAMMDVSDGGQLSRITTSKEAAHEAVTMIERLWVHRGKGLQEGILTGLSFLDKRIGGIADGQVFYIGAPQSTGKTSLLLSMMRHMTVESAIPVGFISIESRTAEVYMRMLCNMARVNWKNARSGYISEQDVRRFQVELPRLSKAPWFISDQGSVTPAQLRRQARRLVQQHGCKAIFIDHFHRMHDPEFKDARMEANSIVRAIRWVARELNVPVIVAAQVSREAKKESSARGGRKPQATDIRESAAIEEDADIMGILAKDFPVTDHGENGQSGFDPESEIWPMNLEIVKQRNGPTGPVEMTFHRPSFRYEDRHLGTGSVEAGQRKAAKTAMAEQLAVDLD